MVLRRVLQACSQKGLQMALVMAFEMTVKTVVRKTSGKALRVCRPLQMLRELISSPLGWMTPLAETT